MKTILCMVALAVSVETEAKEEFYQYLDGVFSMEARFTQKSYDGEGGLLDSSEGLVRLAKPNKFKWIYETPLSQEIVSDGKKVWIFDRDLKQVTITDSIDTERNLLNLAFGGERVLGEYYNVRRVSRKEDEHNWFQITPKDSSVLFEVAYLRFSGEKFSGFELRTSVNRVLKVCFKNVETNMILDDEEFNLVLPEDVDVVEGFLN